MKNHYYEAAVQGIAYELDFATKVFRAQYGRAPTILREDFCGTAALSTAWAQRSPDNSAHGIDLDEKQLDWGRKHHLAYLPPSAGTVTLYHSDVCSTDCPAADATIALNFSYCVFKTRAALLAYFRAARAALRPEGVFIIDLYGGTEALDTKIEPRKIPKSVAHDGTPVPSFTYIWDQARVNVLNHHVTNHIHFQLPGGKKIRRAFTYDWRLWTLPELTELMIEAGFAAATPYISGWKKNGDPDDNYRKRTFSQNAAGWLAYLVGTTV